MIYNTYISTMVNGEHLRFKVQYSAYSSKEAVELALNEWGFLNIMPFMLSNCLMNGLIPLMKPRIRKVKCIIYWEPEEHKDHIPVPGYEVLVKSEHGYDLYGLGETIEVAWQDYLNTKQHQMEVEEWLHK